MVKSLPCLSAFLKLGGVRMVFESNGHGVRE
jgi:hypothetical protein